MAMYLYHSIWLVKNAKKGKLALIVKGKGIGLKFVEESYWSSNWFMNLSQKIFEVVSGHSVVDNYHFSILERNNIIGLMERVSHSG